MFLAKSEPTFVKNLMNSFTISLLVDMSLSPHIIWVENLIVWRCLQMTVFNIAHVSLMYPLFSASSLL